MDGRQLLGGLQVMVPLPQTGELFALDPGRPDMAALTLIKTLGE